MPSRPGMTGWYDPRRLVAIGIRVAEATVFGKMFDRRAPFAEANQREAGVRNWHDRFLFALPGNHDWYDDLTAFARLFCRRHPSRSGSAASPGRSVCGRETRQTRSYFVLKLPHNWWLCAWDVQLDGYVDQTQISFFEYVAQEIMEDGSNVILCVGQPVWAYCQEGAIPEFLHFAFASLIVSGGFRRLDGRPARHHNVRLVLTGDTHNYSHFIEQGSDPNVRVHYLACGQGGAFLHPTHWLRDTTIEVEWKAAQPLVQTPIGTSPAGATPYRLEFRIELDASTGRESATAVFPDKPASAAMTWRNLAFAAVNPQFALFVAGLAIFSASLLHFGSLLL